MKMTKYPKLAIAFLLLTGGIWLLIAQKSKVDSSPSTLEVEVLTLSEGYGYQIKAGEKTLIYQEYIPAMAGKQTFASKEDAFLIGHWVKDQLINGRSPSLTPQLLDSLLTTH